MSERRLEASEDRREAAIVIPDGLVLYKRTAEFTQDTVPAGLLSAHSTKDGVWGRIQVVEGELNYRVLDPRRRWKETVLSPDLAGVVEPTILHDVTARGPTRFYVEFFC
jgi:tellurite resistance-related uncharacterized protein